MRQLISVVTDDHVSYFVHDDDGDAAQQIAQVINPGFDVTDVIDLGSSLTTVLRLNGKRPKTKPPALTTPEPTVTVTPEAELTTRGTPRKRKTPTRRRNWGLVMADVLADVRAHPDSTSFEIATRLLNDTSCEAQQTINNHLHRLRASGDLIYGERAGVDQNGNRRTLRIVRAARR